LTQQALYEERVVTTAFIYQKIWEKKEGLGE
jgi:hypothetical protein